nr:MAG TPA: hypothetical protein [Caudoviricetes sp.]
MASCLSIFLSASVICFSGRREYFLKKVLKRASETGKVQVKGA